MKQDMREQTMKRRMQEALLDLLRTMPLYEISVAQFCREAGVGRTTFYRRYGNIRKLLDELLEEMITRMSSIAGHLADPEEGACKYPLCEFVRRDPRYFALFRNESLTNIIVEKLTAAHREEFIRTMRAYSDWSEEQLELLLRFQNSGCIALIRGSGGTGEEEWAQARETVDRFLRKGLEIPEKTTLP